MSTDDIGIGIVGTGLMAAVHANALVAVRHGAVAHERRPRAAVVAGRRAEPAAEMQRRFRFERATLGWQELVDDPSVEAVVNAGPNNLHAEPSIAAVEAGKHVLCEKPLGRDAPESYEIWQRADAAGVVHLTGFNLRFVPAIERLRALVTSGELGAIRHFRAAYLQDWGADPDLAMWRFDASQSGSGAVGDLASHVLDVAHVLVGDVASIAADARPMVPGRGVDDAAAALLEFASGATGVVEVSRVATGHRQGLRLEVNGSEGSAIFELERPMQLALFNAGGRHSGFTLLNVTEAGDPFMGRWWPPGLGIGWEHSFAHQLAELVDRITGDARETVGATFEDGYRAAEACDALLRSAAHGTREEVVYRRVPTCAPENVARPPAA